MRRSPYARLAGAALASAGLIGLAACASEPEAAPEPAPVETATPTASPTPSATDEAEPVLFTLSARARATDGTSLDLTLTAHPPVAADDDTDLRGDFAARCAATGAKSPSSPMSPLTELTLSSYGASLVPIDLEVGGDGYTLASPVAVSAGSVYSAQVAEGDSIVLVQSGPTCNNVYQLTGSGENEMVLDFESGTSTPDDTLWAYGHYGFSVPTESGTTLETCAGSLGDAVSAADLVGVPGWDAGVDATGVSCAIGYVGE